MTLPLVPGAVFAGDYRVVRPLSAGGMGSVFIVEQLSTGKQRALKVMHAHMFYSQDARERFVREARVGARIPSGHVVEVIASGVDSHTGLPWLAMELLDGEDLSTRLRREPMLPLPLVADLLGQLGHALTAAHGAGVVHRDLKPENLFLARTHRAGQDLVLKVLDFGIAKVVSEASAATTATIGSPGWMAPEQVQRGMAISPATDIWSFALIAFRLLSGQVYWRSATQENVSPIMVVSEMIMESMDSPTARIAQIGGRALPSGFDAWFSACTERDPTRRTSDAALATRTLLGILGCVAPQLTAPAPQSAPTGPWSATVAHAVTQRASHPGSFTPPVGQPSAPVSAPGWSTSAGLAGRASSTGPAGLPAGVSVTPESVTRSSVTPASVTPASVTPASVMSTSVVPSSAIPVSVTPASANLPSSATGPQLALAGSHPPSAALAGSPKAAPRRLFAIGALGGLALVAVAAVAIWQLAPRAGATSGSSVTTSSSSSTVPAPVASTGQIAVVSAPTPSVADVDAAPNLPASVSVAGTVGGPRSVAPNGTSKPNAPIDAIWTPASGDANPLQTEPSSPDRRTALLQNLDKLTEPQTKNLLVLCHQANDSNCVNRCAARLMEFKKQKYSKKD
ncbi:MAG: protein kinase [Polyangiaceae bacterium]